MAGRLTLRQWRVLSDVLSAHRARSGGSPCLSRLGDFVAPAIVELGSAALEQSTSLVLDLGAVTFMDSTGIGALITLRNLAESAAKGLILVNVSNAVAKVLAINGLTEVFRVPAHSGSETLQPVTQGQGQVLSLLKGLDCQSEDLRPIFCF